METTTYINDVIDFIQHTDTKADGVCGQHEITQQETRQG